jgi:hypothetical protein
MNRVTDAIRGRLANMLKQRLSERTKRILFVASFSAQLKDPGTLNGEMVSKLNSMLELASDDAALKFPIHLSQVIWRNRPLEPGLRVSLRNGSLHSRASSLGKKIMDAMPSWMQYGDESKMQSDIEQLLRWQRA